MSIQDLHNTFSDAQAITVDAASTNVVDQGAAGDANIALWLVIETVAALATGTSINFQLRTDTVENFASPTILWESGAVLTAAMTINTTLFKVRIPAGAQQYLGVYYDITDAFDAGTVNAYLTADPDHGNA